MVAEIEEPEYTDPPDPEPAPPKAPTPVTFRRRGEPHGLPSFALWVVAYGFDPAALTARQLDSLLGFYLTKYLDALD